MAEAQLRPAVSLAAFAESDASLEPLLEEAVLRQRRRREAAVEALQEYEAEHGEITDEEIAALEAEWLT